MSRYDLFRRRIAPIAFGVAIVLIARDSCDKQARTHATFVLDFGAAAREVRTVDAELWSGGDQIVVFHRAALDRMTIGPTKFSTALPAEDGQLRVSVQLANGDVRKLSRSVHADDGATVTIPLESALR